MLPETGRRVELLIQWHRGVLPRVRLPPHSHLSLTASQLPRLPLPLTVLGCVKLSISFTSSARSPATLRTISHLHSTAGWQWERVA